MKKKWVKGQTRPYGFKGYKNQKCGLRAHYMNNLVFEGERKEKMEKI